MTGKQRSYLRGLAHHLQPVVSIGKRGVTASVVRQIAQALEDHELIKVRVLEECPIERDEAAGVIGLQAECEVAGKIGRVLVLYRAHPEKPRIELPEPGETEE